jgi:photosystem II stability/assembly factor-like uncharacterized protein
MKNSLLLLSTITLILNINIYSQWELRVDGLPLWEVANPLDIAEDSTIAAFVRKPERPRPINISYNFGQTWTNYYTPDSWDGIDVSIIDKNNIWFCTDTKIYHSNNGGVDWTLQYHDTSNTTFLNFIHFFDKDTGIVVGDALLKDIPALILRTTDGGKTWLSINKEFLIGALSRDAYYPIEFPTKNIGYFYDSRKGKLFKTINGGISWDTVTLPSEIRSVFMLKFYDEYLGFLVQDNGVGEDLLFRTINGGENWTKLSLLTNTWHHDIEFIPSHPERVWFTDYDHLFYSADTGNTWQEVKITEDILEARNIEFLNDTIGFILCDDGKFFATENNGGIITSVETKENNIVNDYKLYQNYPNPFNPTTKISYQVPTSGNVKVTVYDLLGNEVAELVNENKNIGNYEVEFKANNLSSGVYFYQITAGNFIQSKKMILLR